jgi:hypothetical protein
MITFAFGIVHGFGFSFALRDELQFAGDHLVASLLAFNLGVEIGQVLLLLVFVPALALFFRYVPERIGTSAPPHLAGEAPSGRVTTLTSRPPL